VIGLGKDFVNYFYYNTFWIALASVFTQLAQNTGVQISININWQGLTPKRKFNWYANVHVVS